MKNSSTSFLPVLLGTLGALVFYFFALPLPWVLGSMTACAVASLSGLPMRLPAWWRALALAVLGVLLGGSFTASTLQSLPDWWRTISLMLLLSGFYLLFSNFVLARWSGMTRLTRMFSAVPGGLAILSALSELYDADTRRIALNHSARLVSLLVLVPIVLSFVGEHDLQASAAAGGLVAFERAHLWQHGLLFLSAVAGPVLVRVIPFPLGVLLFPFLLSALLHGTGVVEVQLPAVVAATAQVVLGASIGIRFAGYSWRDIFLDGWLSIAIGVLLALMAAAAAWAASLFLEIEFPVLLLIFMPGGAAEMGVMAIALEADPAMVATHHILRVLAVVGGLSLALSWFLPARSSFKKKQS